MDSDSERKPDSQELTLFSQETYEELIASQGTHDLLCDLMTTNTTDEEVMSVMPEPSLTQTKLQTLDEKTLFSYGGAYDFQISFRNEEFKVAKSCPWTYSKTMDKLYMSMDCYCSFHTSVAILPPPGCILRATMLYKKDEHSGYIPIRCPTHASSGHSTNFGCNHPEQLIRSDLKTAEYGFYPSGRSYVTVPFTAGVTQKMVLNLKVMCRNSCEGGLSRRPTVIVITLERNGQNLGRFCKEVRVCSCPGRDRAADESKEQTRLNQNPSSLGQNIKQFAQSLASEDLVTHSNPGKRLRTEIEYEIQTKDKRCYRILSSLRDMLEKNE